LLHPFAYGETFGPFRTLEKGILVLYQMINGLANSDLPIPESSYYLIQNDFWEHCNTNKDQNILKKKINWCSNWFRFASNAIVRILHSRVHNPPRFKHVTLLVDGKDIVTKLQLIANEYEQTKNGKSNLISRKNKWKNGGKQQELMDSRGQTLFLSSTEGANSIYDGKQIYKDLKKLPKVHLTHIFDPKTDNIAMDNHFPSYIKKFIEKFKDYGYSEKNMTSPIAKKRN